ncbi:efflux RND transporter permease subunit [Flavobacterium sp. K5-23]|uniref:efflux RND transporter permease subunit n=1 Tax=Flavobacterium sp. K5-23 TaxID=2746225 RepID=UPI002010343F|nr:efflux RND transporter permease subunit [Flavobacterium sp. K5-23]UQD55765.1 efflux RND transporter permease subunit [Flavobacterium sp. K5-23]
MSTNNKNKEFKLSSLAIDNKMTVYVIMALFFVLGISAYYAMPREDFPEIKETKIYISTIYPGNTAEDIERLVIDPLEEDIKNISNVVEIVSTSQEDYGIITVEFDEKISVEDAKQKVKDKVDAKKSNEDWPTFNGVKVEPNVFDLNLSEEIPILNINLSGDFPIEKLKEFGEYLKDEIEGLAEIKQVNIRGAQEKEVEVAVDVFKMMASKVSFDDVINAIRNGNVTMSAGNIISSGQRRTISIKGEIEKPTDLENFVVKTQNGTVYLKDVATVTFKNVDKTTYAREFGKSVVMLDVKKRAGKNMIEASEKIKTIIANAKENVLPKDLNLTLSNDSSSKTLNQVDDLVNNVIFGIVLVVGVLMFFLGFRNALFVGFAIPMSMFLSFMVLDALGYTMNTMILFGLIMGLGMLVDNGIVVVENVYRLMEDEGMGRLQAAKEGIGEIAMPIIISTLTTVAAFVPLGLWPGVMGQFMVYFPITLSVVLGSSLFVAIFFNSVMVSQFMDINEKILTKKQLIRLTLILGSFGLLILFFGGAVRGLGSLMLFTVLMFWLYKYVIKDRTLKFQNNTLNKLENSYEKGLKFFLTGKKPYIVVIVMFFMFFIVLITYFGWSVGSGRTKVEFFPDNKPNQIIVYVEYPQGTDIEKTNTITKDIEKRVYAVLDAKEFVDETTKSNYLVESAVSQVGEGAGNPQTDGGSSAEMPHKAKITVSMQEYKYRNGRDSEEMRLKVQEALKDIYPGISISVEKDQAGPPAGYPINIEIKGKDYTELIVTAEKMKDFLNGRNVPGIDELKVDVNKGKPAMRVVVDREKAGGMGISAGQVGNQLRRSVFGEKAGVYKESGEDYDINVRFNNEDRYNQSTLFNQNITFRDMASGQLKEIPVSTVASQKNTSSFSAIKHRDLNRVVVLYSALSPGFTDAGSVVNQIQAEMADFDAPKSVKFDFTGQIEEQNKQMSFLMGALFTGLGLIMLILVFQFNSISKPAIIMVAVFLSFIGVFLGLMITGWPFVIMMTMMGIISLAGIVVNNGVVLLDYTELLLSRKKEELNVPESTILDKEYIFEAIVSGGKARLRPVLLTAITTVLGLIPLAIGFNIDFFSLFSDLDPKIYMGGDNVIFWGPLAWTVIFGLVFATFLTLIVVPVLYYLVNLFKLWRITKKVKI